MPRRVVSLNGSDWSLGKAPADADPGLARWQEVGQVRDWLPAIVPGDVRADLVRAGILPDLDFGMESEGAQWVDDHCWWLVGGFHLSGTPNEPVHLTLRGVDYLSDLFLNGHHLGRHEGMFSPQVHDVTHLLCGENRLAVRILGSRWLPARRSGRWGKLLNRVEARLSSMPARFPDRRDTLKCQMGFGWDFAPALRTMGIWDDVYLTVSEQVFIHQIAIRQRLERDWAVVTVHLEIDAHLGGPVQLRCSLQGATFESEAVTAERPIELASGSSEQTIELRVARPQLWWPWDHGHPHLYRLSLEVWAGDKLLDSTTELVGLREVELDGRTLRINGRHVFARGANWVPADLMPGVVTESDYRDLLLLARRANMNLLRVWGGGLREKRAFYRACDELGILVWQEFPFACAFLTRYPRSQEYLSLVEAEAQAIVQDLRNHPSLAVWCGGSEFDPKRNAPLGLALREVLARADPTRPFLPASPGPGDSHNWQVWHHFRPPAVYRQDKALFASEFGLQAPPLADALRHFIPEAELWPAGPSWGYHGAGMKKLWRYARPFLAEPEPALEQFIDACQRAQVYGLQVAIEHYRRRRANGCGGALVWQFNEPWPAISWALLDSYRHPKPAYETVKRLFNPLLVSVDYPLNKFQAGDRLRAAVWVINDLPQALPDCQWEAAVWHQSDQLAQQCGGLVNVPPEAAIVAGSLDCLLPEGGGWRLTCSLEQGGQLLSFNDYDLSVYDNIQPTPKQRLQAWLAGLVMRS